MTTTSSEIKLQWISLTADGDRIAIHLPGLGSYRITREEAGEARRWLGVQLGHQS